MVYLECNYIPLHYTQRWEMASSWILLMSAESIFGRRRALIIPTQKFFIVHWLFYYRYFGLRRIYLSVFRAQILPHRSISVHLKVSEHFVFGNALLTSFKPLLEKLYFQIQAQKHSCHRTDWSRLVLGRRLVRISVGQLADRVFWRFSSVPSR
jgi:hypothetical protein